MAYLPPHKRHSKDSPSLKPTPVPSSIIPQFNQTLTLGGGGGRREQSNTPNPRRRHDRQSSSSFASSNHGVDKIIWAANSISRWFAAGSGGDDPIPSSLRLAPFGCDVLEWRNGVKPLVIEGGEGGGEDEERPWVRIAERIVPDLVGCFRRAAVVEGLEPEREVVKLSVVGRLGKVLFLGNSVGLTSLRTAANAETDSREQVSKLFYINISTAYMDVIKHSVIPKIGFYFDSEKEHYHVKVFDKSRPESIISCKCTVVNDGGSGTLEIHKIELKQVRHLVVDISCIYKDLDLRLMLVTKRTMKSLDDEENEGINKLIKSAIIDPDVKGGLRWPLGQESVADRFSIVGAWHTKYNAFKSQTTRIKLGHADRFDHKTSTGKVSTEVTFKLLGISKYLRDGIVEDDHIKGMIQEEVKLIWDHFLSYDHSST